MPGWHNGPGDRVPSKKSFLLLKPSEQRVTSCSHRKQLRWHTEHVTPHPSSAQKRSLSHTRDTFSSKPQCPVQALLPPSLSWYSNQSTQLKTWEDIKYTELCQKPSQKWQLLHQSYSSLKSLNGKVGLDRIPRQIQGSSRRVPHGAPPAWMPGEMLKMYKLWADHSPNQPNRIFRSPADPNQGFCFSVHLDALPCNAFSNNVTPALCNTAERASRRKHSRKPGSIMTFNHSALMSPELALFEVKYSWHKKTTLGTSPSSSAVCNCEFPATRREQQGHSRNSYLATSENTTPLSGTHWHTSGLNTNAIQD